MIPPVGRPHPNRLVTPGTRRLSWGLTGLHRLRYRDRGSLSWRTVMPLLQVKGLVKFYGRRCVVNGVDFEVNTGEVVGLLGPNGAGETTSFRMATGQITPNAGTVWFNGEEVTHLPMYQRARIGMGYLSQETSVFRKL